MELNSGTVIQASTDQVSAGIGEETVILELSEGVYFSVDYVGAVVWKAIVEPRSIQQICDQIASEYDVEPSACEKDLKSLLDDLAKCGLIEIHEQIADKLAI